MITRYPYASLGGADHGWLKARHHFSFAEYRDPKRMGFGALRVVNDDIVGAGTGFDTHPHRDMEIITYVRRGAISHRDNAGNEGVTRAGDVQVMSAGTGILHSEHNREPQDTNLYQIWIIPHTQGVAPRWEARSFPKTPVTERLIPLASGREADIADGALRIYQDAAIHGGRLQAGVSLAHPILHQAYFLVSEGTVEVDGTVLEKGDGAEIVRQSQIVITAKSDAEVLVIDVPELA